MPQAPVASQVHQPLDVHRDVSTQVAFDFYTLVDALPDLGYLRLSEVVGPGVYVHTGFKQNSLRSGSPYPEDIGQCNLDPLIFG